MKKEGAVLTGLGMAIEQQIQELVRVEVAKSISKVIENLPEPEPVDPIWMTAKDFCRKYTIARSTLQRMKEQGRVKVLHGGGKLVRYRWKRNGEDDDDK